jgi:aminocarboxymuconate-semialdehyde decarboxylase
MKRREFLHTVGVLGAATSLGSSQRELVVDIHSHYYPSSYFDLIRTLGAPDYEFGTDPSGTTIIKYRGTRFFGIQPPMTDLSLRLEDMDRNGVDVQVLSVSVPNVFFADESSEPKIAREANDAYAEIVARHPNRFRALASIPMSDSDEAVKELARARDELKLNGAILLSHVRGKPLTDPSFRPFFEEANRRELFVLIHPMLPSCMAPELEAYVLGPLVGFLFDSTLAVARMCFDGLFRDFPGIRFLVPHLGGALPYLLGRLDQGHKDFAACRAKIDLPPSAYLKKLYFDTVTASSEAIALARDVIGIDRIALGTDYPHLPGSMAGTLATIRGLDLPDGEKRRILGGTALEILGFP